MLLIASPGWVLAGAAAIALADWTQPPGMAARVPAGQAPWVECLLFDPGHSDATAEGRAVMTAATHILDHLRTMGIEARLTRTVDQAPSAQERLQAATTSGCKLLISLHLEASSERQSASWFRLYHRLDDPRSAAAAARLGASLKSRFGQSLVIEPIVNHPLFGAATPVLILSLGAVDDPGMVQRLASAEFSQGVAEAAAGLLR